MNIDIKSRLKNEFLYRKYGRRKDTLEKILNMYTVSQLESIYNCLTLYDGCLDYVNIKWSAKYLCVDDNFYFNIQNYQQRIDKIYVRKFNDDLIIIYYFDFFIVIMEGSINIVSGSITQADKYIARRNLVLGKDIQNEQWQGSIMYRFR